VEEWGRPVHASSIFKWQDTHLINYIYQLLNCLVGTVIIFLDLGSNCKKAGMHISIISVCVSGSPDEVKG
jgi:hypothetical protein